MGLNNIQTGGSGGLSDGGLRNLTEISAIPDSVDYQWRTPISGLSDGDPVSTWPDSADGADGAGTSVTYSEGGFNGDDYVDGSSTDAIVRTEPLDLVMQGSWTWAFTYRSTQDSRAIMGQDEGSDNYYVRWDVFQAGSGEPEFVTQSADAAGGTGGEARVSGSTDVHDGNVYSVVWVKDGNDPTGWEIWVGEPGGDITQESITVEANNVPDLSGITPQADFCLFDRDQEDFPIDTDINWMELSGGVWSQTQVEDFHERVGFSNGGGSGSSLTRTTISETATDGGQLADLNDSGSLDVVAAGIDGSAYWYDSDNNWQEHSIATGFSAPEGIDAGDYDGDGDIEVILLDQGSGDVAVIDQDNSDPTGSWTSAVIDSNAPNVQHSLSADLTGDGTPDLIYTYEGTTSGEGGLYWLEYTGGTVTNASNWTKHTITQTEGVWGLARQRVDLSGDGNATDIVFGARDFNNDSASGGLWWAEQPSDPTGSWSVTAIDTSIAPLNVDVGDFSGDGNPTDVVVGLYDTGTGVYWYDAGDWSQNTITASDEIWNVRGWNTGSGAWNVLADDVASNTLTYYVNDGSGGFASDATASMYKADDRWPRGDVDGNGSDNEFVATSEDEGIDLWEVSG